MKTLIEKLENAMVALHNSFKTQEATISRQEVRMGELHERVNDMANRVAGVKTKSDLTETHFVEACDNIVKRYALKSELTEIFS